MNDAVTVNNLSFAYAGHRVLDDITFRVQKGEIFGLLGPSGAGKTTLIKILTGQLGQYEGYAAVFEGEIQKAGRKERGRIGVMTDSLGLYERLSVYDNLAFFADIYRVPRSTIHDRLKSIGLYEGRHTAVAKLSRGMKNRLSLARALLNNADLLFLDEPASGLDPATTREIHAALTKEKERGATIFLTTHNMYEAQSLCDHIALLSGGSIIEYGRPADICRKYNRINRLCVTLKDGEQVMLENGSVSAEAVREYLEQNRIEAIHSTEPTLEDVFVELTGKGLDGYA